MVGIITNRFPPGVQRLPVTAPAEDFILLLKRDGGVIIENYASEETMEKCNKEIGPQLERDQSWAGEFFPVLDTQLPR